MKIETRILCGHGKKFIANMLQQRYEKYPQHIAERCENWR